jgi:single-stranded DNA-binding protein
MSEQKKSYQENKIVFVGNVANDPTSKTVSVGGVEKEIAEFRVINHRVDTTTAVTVKAWGDVATSAMSTAKGSLVKIEGSLGIRRNKNAETGLTYTEVNINAKTITTLASKKTAAAA